MVVQAPTRIQSLVDRYLETRPSVCTERARIAVESYKTTEAEVPVIRAARALDAVLRRMTIWVLDDELILGHWASTFRGVPVWPEWGVHPPQLGFQSHDPKLIPTKFPIEYSQRGENLANVRNAARWLRRYRSLGPANPRTIHAIVAAVMSTASVN